MIGRTLSHYRIDSPLGAGGMGLVFRTRDLHLERDVALKLLPEGALADASARKRFRREALALSRLNHPHIATVFDFDTQEGLDFLVMELVEGEPLTARIARGALPEPEVRALGAQIAAALEAAHEQGIVHRDLKPANVMLTPRGQIKVLDFGLARLVRPAAGTDLSHSLTDTGVTVGTVPYMAPEQVLGRAVDARSDLYALGVVLYELASGRSPYRETVPTALIYEIIHQPVAPLREVVPGLSPALEAIVARCLAKEPEGRYPSARALAADLGDADRMPSAPRPATASGKGRRAWIAWAAAAAVVALLVLASGLAPLRPLRDRLLGGGGATPVRTLAVLPLENLSGDPEQEFFADGMTDELLTRLAQISSLKVIARASVMHYKGTKLPLRDVARELGADALVTGTVMRSGGRARIAAQLVRPTTGESLWADSFEGGHEDVLALQNRVARAVAERIQARMSTRERGILASERPVNAEAHELCLKGRYFWAKLTEEDGKRAIEFFKKALDEDPTHAPAYAGLADAYYDLSDLHLSPRQAIPLSRGNATKALQLDEGLPEAHATLAVVKTVYDWDWAGAEREYRRAIELSPSHATTHLRYAQHLIYVGRPEEARAEFERALELDPINPSIIVTAAWPDYYTRPESRRLGRIIERLQEFARVDSTFEPTRYGLAMAWLQKGDPQRVISLLGREEGDLARGAWFPLALLGCAHARTGRRVDAERVLATLVRRSREEFISPCAVAAILTAVGRTDEAFGWLEKAYDQRSEWLVYLNVEPLFDSLHGDPRFADLIRRLGLSPASGS